MNIDQFHAITQTRIPTPQEFIQFANGQHWRIVVNEDGKAALRVQDRDDPLAHALAKMMAREPYRTNVLNVVRENEPTPAKEISIEAEPTECERCGGTWYCTKEEAIECVTASPHWCDLPRCPFRTTPKRSG